ncbi:hypothetical protein NT95_04240 [Oenococcus kitaharae]|nr:hypothetical protein NT95_04240 [Oenococcus kitaharae]OEY85149.1 hypothetical protein NT96_00685 [Oenococcus kitaharae]OEY86004.1 hypothetical protein NV75_00635 [Oenococcus kitaharae]
MAIITEVLIYLYAALMIIATFSARSKMPIWLFGANLISGILLACFQLNPIFLRIGLLALITVAILNGSLMNKKIHLSHLLLRLLISLLLYLLFTTFH